MTPASPAQKSVWSTPLHSIPFHSSPQWHWEVQQSLEWMTCMKWRSTPASGYSITHCSTLCEAEASATSLFPPSPLQDLQLRTTRKSQGQEVRRVIYCTWSHWLLSWPQLARRERRRLFVFAKGWECEWGRLCPVGQIQGCVWRGESALASCSLLNLITKSLSCCLHILF